MDGFDGRFYSEQSKSLNGPALANLPRDSLLLLGWSHFGRFYLSFRVVGLYSGSLPDLLPRDMQCLRGSLFFSLAFLVKLCTVSFKVVYLSSRLYYHALIIECFMKEKQSYAFQPVMMPMVFQSRRDQLHMGQLFPSLVRFCLSLPISWANSSHSWSPRSFIWFIRTFYG